MDLGAFSVSLTVKDLTVSSQFYAKLGFTAFAGDAAHGWLVLRNGDSVIGLFQGMFDRNLMTFNPGWDTNAQPVDSFTDVRELQRELKASGLEPAPEVDGSASGPAYFMLTDPDGNQILVDQHV
jgi:catechol 2,3-dioxygenase-like lactoylglutathione lyase family enzyme